MTIYETDWICPISSPPIRNGSIAVENGRIVPLPPEEGQRDGAAGDGLNRVRFPGCAIIPGFVNGPFNRSQQPPGSWTTLAAVSPILRTQCFKTQIERC